MRAALGLTLVAACAAAAPPPVEVTVGSMRLDPTSGSPVIRLVEKQPAAGAPVRELPIWIGLYEAQAIAMQLEGVPPPRPLTHDLMKGLVEQLGGKLVRVVIEDLRDNTYYATVHLAAPGGRRRRVDARPSDAIALALRLKGPILVSEELFAKAATGTAPTPAAVRIWGLTVQDLTPEIAAFFEMTDARGVLVADVTATAAAREMVRGDVITALDDAPVASVAELTARAGTRPNGGRVHLAVRRGGRALQVSFTPE